MRQAMPLPVQRGSDSLRLSSVSAHETSDANLRQAFLQLQAEHLRLTGENQALRQQLKQAMTFAHRVAHDLKGPARKIASFASMLQRSVPQNHPGSARAQLGLERNVKLLRQTIDEYLRASVQKTVPKDISLDDLLEKTIEPLRTQYDAVDVTSVSFGKLRTHPTALKRILHNVLDNAFKFKDRSSKKPHRVHIDGQKRGSVFVITIDDNGCGQGASVHHPARGHGMGLDSLETELQILGASLTLRDWPSGTRAEIHLPLR